jgi:excisionase family DNA binding protein
VTAASAVRADAAFDSDASDRLLLKIDTVAVRLDCGRTTVYRLINEGELPAVKVGRSTRIPASAVVAYVERLIIEQVTQ